MSKAPVKLGEGEPAVGSKLNLSPKEWKKRLTPEQYRILREHGTERAFTGELWNHKGHGVYRCVACDAPLFASNTKFKSGTGWPSFYQPIQKGRIAEHKDNTYGMVRVEVRCDRCDGHLGHVFNDGPQPTGLRYCINSAALKFDEVPVAAAKK
ncbi:MAG: peptide-methionine (R)-S-oxide reductase MsrB [Bradymonadia bacterium]